MALILNIESSTSNCSVSLSKNGNLIHFIEKNDPEFSQSDNLHLYIKKLLSDCDFSLNSLDAISISKGPGSYTGLRIGVATAKGICFSCDLPLISINTLEILAAAYIPENETNIIALLDARRMEVYSMFLNSNHEVMVPTKAEIISINSFKDFIKISKKVVIIGNGAQKCKKVLISGKIFYPDEPLFPSSKFMCKKSEENFKKKIFEDIAYFEPFYLKDFYTSAKKISH